MDVILDVATEQRLARLDRRLRVVESRNRLAGRYDIVYEDAGGITCTALKNIHEVNNGVFRSLLKCMPWRFNQAFHQHVKQNVDDHNDRISDAHKQETLHAAGERAWDDLQFLEQHGGKGDLVAGYMRDSMNER